MKQPVIGERKVVYENVFQRVCQVHVDFETHSRDHFVTDYQHRAGVVVVHDGRVLMVRQYRLLIESLSLEIPGGLVDKGESPSEAAVRECLEETGVRCQDLQPLITYHPGLDTLYHPTHLFFSTHGAEAGEAFIHKEEVSEKVWMPIAQCRDMIFGGHIADALSIIALLSYISKDRAPA